MAAYQCPTAPGDPLEKKQTSLLAGSAVFFVSSLIIYAARFATSVLVARTIGVEGKGIYILVLMVGSLLVLFLSLGLGGSLTYFTASKHFETDTLYSFSLVASLLISLLGGFGFYILYGLFLANTFLIGIGPQYILLVLILLPFNLISLFFSSIILGKQQLVAFNLINIIRVVSNLLFQLMSALSGGGLPGAILAWFTSNLVAFGVTLWFVRGDFHPHLRFTRHIIKPATSYGIKNYLANLFMFFNYRLDTFFVNFYSGATEVGLYSTGVGVAELIWYIPNAISGALFPKSSSMSKETSARLTAQVARQSLVVAAGLTIVSALIGPLVIPFFYGIDFLPSVKPFLWLLPGILGITLSKIVSANLAGIGKPQYATYSSGITIVITVVLDILLIPPYGIVGAAIASSIAYLLSAGLSVMWFSRETNIRWLDVVFPRKEDISLLVSRSLKLANTTRSELSGRLSRRKTG